MTKSLTKGTSKIETGDKQSKEEFKKELKEKLEVIEKFNKRTEKKYTIWDKEDFAMTLAAGLVFKYIHKGSHIFSEKGRITNEISGFSIDKMVLKKDSEYRGTQVISLGYDINQPGKIELYVGLNNKKDFDELWGYLDELTERFSCLDVSVSMIKPVRYNVIVEENKITPVVKDNLYLH